MSTKPVYLVTPQATPVRGALGLLWDAIADAEREVQKLRGLLVKHLCDCRKLATELPLEPYQHRLTCKYRRAMQ